MAFLIDSIVRATIPAIIVGLFALFRRHIRIPDRDRDLIASADASIASPLAVNLCILVLACVIAFTAHGALVELNRFFAHKTPGVELVLYPSTAIWWFFPGFAGITFGWEVMLRLWTRLNPNAAEAYRAFSNLKSGFDSTKVLRWMGLLIALPIGILTLLALPVHSTLTSDAIWDGRYASLHEAIYAYADVVQITRFDGYLARDGSFTPRAGILLRLKDGRTWNSADTDDPKPTVDPALLNLLATHIKTPIAYSHLEPK